MTSIHDTLTNDAALSESVGFDFGHDEAAPARAALPLALDNATPGTLDRPAFLMNCPFSYAAEEPNNVWMRELDEEHRKVDRTRAMIQFGQVYRHLAADGFVFLLPTPKSC